MELLPSPLPEGGWDSPQGLSVFLLAAVIAFAIVGYAVAHWWAPVLARGRASRPKTAEVVVVVVASLPAHAMHAEDEKSSVEPPVPRRG